ILLGARFAILERLQLLLHLLYVLFSLGTVVTQALYVVVRPGDCVVHLLQAFHVRQRFLTRSADPILQVLFEISPVSLWIEDSGPQAIIDLLQRSNLTNYQTFYEPLHPEGGP